MATPYNAPANRAAFRKLPGWQQKGEASKVKDYDSIDFTSTTMRIWGSSSIIVNADSCTVSFEAADSPVREGANAAVLLSALTGDTTASGLKNSGMVIFDYKKGKAAVSVKNRVVSLTLLKI